MNALMNAAMQMDSLKGEMGKNSRTIHCLFPWYFLVAK